MPCGLSTLAQDRIRFAIQPVPRLSCAVLAVPLASRAVTGNSNLPRPCRQASWRVRFFYIFPF